MAWKYEFWEHQLTNLMLLAKCCVWAVPSVHLGWPDMFISFERPCSEIGLVNESWFGHSSVICASSSYHQHLNGTWKVLLFWHDINWDKQRDIPAKLECVLPRTLLWTVCNDPIQPYYNLWKSRSYHWLWVPAFLNQSTKHRSWYAYQQQERTVVL